MKKTFTGVTFKEGVEALKRWNNSPATVYSWLQTWVYDKPEEWAKKHVKKVTITIEIEDDPIVEINEEDFDQSA